MMKESVGLFEIGREVLIMSGARSATSTLRGWKKNQYLLIDKPRAVFDLTIGASFIIRSATGIDDYVGLTVDYEDILFPFNLLVLKITNEIVESSKITEGYNISLPLKISYEADGVDKTIDGVISELGAKGLDFISKDEIPMGVKARFTIQLPTGSVAENIFAHIDRKSQSEGRFHYDARFDTLEYHDLGPVLSYVELLEEGVKKIGV